MGRAALLVPLPTATDDHQRRNAEALVRAGAAEMLEQRELTGAALAARILALLDDDARRQRAGAGGEDASRGRTRRGDRRSRAGAGGAAQAMEPVRRALRRFERRPEAERKSSS